MSPEDFAEIIPFPEPKAPEFSEDAMALAFADQHATSLRYVAHWGRWMMWTGACWRRDTTLAAFNSIRPLVRVNASDAADGSEKGQKLARSIASASTVAAVERLARADRRIAASSDIWDADPMLFGTPGGYIDLRTCEAGPCGPDAWITRLAAVAPSSGDACPRWMRFLEEVTHGDEEYIAYLQRVAGYCLTGDTSEHVLFFLHGTGRNGKGVFTRRLMHALGDYAAAASMDTFIEARGERHPTDLAMLQGARLVIASETEKDRYWAEARVKQLTGGDPVTARFMRQDFFTYTPQFKVLIAGNHLPRFATRDEALRARLHILPFSAFFPPALRDTSLDNVLAAEAPGILRWAINGCRAWQDLGLSPPDVVKRATAEYFRMQDPVSRWMDQRCILDTGGRTAFAALWADWENWSGAAGEHAGSEKQFSQALRNRGLEPGRTPGSGRSEFLGIRIAAQTDRRSAL